MPASLRFQTTVFGGLNVNDQSDSLLLRSHTFTEGGWQQKSPAEATKVSNIDFDNKGFSKRKGSTLDDDMSSIMAVGEIILAAMEYYSANGSRIIVRVTSVSIYTNQSGSFVKINDSSSSTYSHAATATKCTMAIADGHLFIGLDGANKIQVYQNGADLDAELNNGNTYEDANGSGTHTIDGAWANGTYLLASFQGRLVYSDGNTVVTYSSVPIATDGIWKKSTAGFYQTAGFILAIKTFIPDYGDSIRQTLYIFTSHGPEITNDLGNEIQTIADGPVPINHQSVVSTKSWLVLMTTDRKIVGINRNVVIDLSRRFSSRNGVSKIDTFDISNSLTEAFGFYNKEKEQVYFYTPDSGSSTNTHCFVIDLTLGEPVLGEPQAAFEQRVRLAIWEVSLPTTNVWYSAMYRKRGSVVAITKEGKAYTFLNGKNDLDTVLIDATYESLDFNAGIQSVNKKFLSLSLRGQFLGNFTVTIAYLYEKATLLDTSTVSYSQKSEGASYGEFFYGTSTYTGVIYIKGKDNIHLVTESLILKINNAMVDQTFTFDTVDIKYLIGRENR